MLTHKPLKISSKAIRKTAYWPNQPCLIRSTTTTTPSGPLNTKIYTLLARTLRSSFQNTPLALRITHCPRHRDLNNFTRHHPPTYGLQTILSAAVFAISAAVVDAPCDHPCSRYSSRPVRTSASTNSTERRWTAGAVAAGKSNPVHQHSVTRRCGPS